MMPSRRAWGRGTLRGRWGAGFLLAGSFFLALFALFVSATFRSFVINAAQRDLRIAADAVIQQFYLQNAQIKKDMEFTFAQNQRLLDALTKANVAFEAQPKEAAVAHARTVETGWKAASWEELRAQVTDEEINQILAQYRALDRLPLAEIFVTDRRGLLVGSTGKTSDYDQADEEWWQKTFNGGLGSVYHSEIEFDESAGVYSLIIAAPIYSVQGAVIGVLKGVIDKDRVFQSIFDLVAGPGMVGGILRADGTDLFFSAPGTRHNYLPSSSLFDHVTSRRGMSDRLTRPTDGRRFIVGYSRMDAGLLSWSQGAFVYFAKEEREALGPVRRLNVWLFFMWLGATLIFGALGVRMQKAFWAALALFKDGLTYAKRGIFDHKIPAEGRDEFDMLAGDFNDVVEELRRNTLSRNYFHQIIQSMSDMLFVIDSNGAVEIVNRRLCAVLEYEERELKGKPAVELFAKKDRYIVSWGLRGLIEEGALGDKKVVFLTKGGREVETYLGTRSLRDAASNLIGLVCLAKDLTEMNRFLDALRRSNEEILRHKQELEKLLSELQESRDVMLSVLEDTNEAKLQAEEMIKKLRGSQEQIFHAEKMISLGQIAAGVAHEINNPVFVISDQAKLLSEKRDLPQGVTDAVRVISEQVARIDDIIKRLLEFSRRKESRSDPVEVHALLAKTIELFQYQMKTLPHIQLVREFVEGPLWVLGDENQLIEIFLNLMINAAEAMEDKGGLLKIRTFPDTVKPGQAKISSPFQPGDQVACVQVIDTGVGMNAETISHIFDPFFTTKKTGTGLGLPVCYGIVNNHKGVIDVESIEGQGATFTVRLPVHKAPQP